MMSPCLNSENSSSPFESLLYLCKYCLSFLYSLLLDNETDSSVDSLVSSGSPPLSGFSSAPPVISPIPCASVPTVSFPPCSMSYMVPAPNMVQSYNECSVPLFFHQLYSGYQPTQLLQQCLVPPFSGSVCRYDFPLQGGNKLACVNTADVCPANSSSGEENSPMKRTSEKPSRRRRNFDHRTKQRILELYHQSLRDDSYKSIRSIAKAIFDQLKVETYCFGVVV